jgi:hypothetical protein
MGLWPPRLSMARAMSASGELNPNATRVMSRILVLTDDCVRRRAMRRPRPSRAPLRRPRRDTRWTGASVGVLAAATLMVLAQPERQPAPPRDPIGTADALGDS